MANRAGKTAMAVAMAGAILTPSIGSASETTPWTDPQAHVRPTTAAVASLINRATEGSATFRQMVRTIQDSDTYVYVLEGDCGHGVRACFTGVTIAGARRIMRVTVALDPRQPDWYAMGSIGHELRHTIEAIEVPTVRSSAAQFFLYERIGFHSTGHSHETLAARDAGNIVRSEVRRFNRSAKRQE